METSINTNSKTSSKGCSDYEYTQFLRSIQQTFEENTEHGQSIFTTNCSTDLFQLFLISIPEENRQHYNCRTCKEFINKYGSLVTIDNKGETIPLIWKKSYTTLPFFNLAFTRIYSIVKKSKVTGVFYSDIDTLGKPVTLAKPCQNVINWHHMALTYFPVYNNPLMDSFQAMANKKEDFKTISRALLDYSDNTLFTAVNLLETDNLYRSQKVLG